MTTIRNNTPRVIFNGIKDESIEQLLPELEEEPIHLPLFYPFTQKGPIYPVLCGPNGDFKRIFGSESLNVRGPYYSHVTKLLETVSGAANSVLVKRLIPDDATYAGLTLFAKVTRNDTVANGALYRRARNGDGSYVINTITVNNVSYSKPMYVATTGTAGTPIIPTDGYITPVVTAGSITGFYVNGGPTLITAANAAINSKSFRVEGMMAYDADFDTETFINNGHVITFDGAYAIDAIYKPYQTKVAIVAADVTGELIADSVSIAWEYVPVVFTNGVLDSLHTTITLGTVPTDDDGAKTFHTMLIPVQTLLAPSPGLYGNNIGYRQWINDTYSSDVVEDNKTLVMKGQFLERAKVGKPAYIVPTLTNAASVDFTYNLSAFNESTQEELVTDNLVEGYNDDGIVNGTSPTIGPCGQIILHDMSFTDLQTTTYDAWLNTTFISQGITRGIDIVYSMLATVESDARAAEANKVVWDDNTNQYVADAVAIGDFDVDTDAQLLNIFTGVSSNSVPYYGFKVSSFGATSDGTLNESFPGIEAPSSVNFDSVTTYWFGNGTDGTLTNTVMEEQLVWEIEQNFDNAEYDLTDTGRYPFSAIYDSGYTFATKPVLFNWLGYRKDVHVAIATHAEGEKLDIATEEGRAASLIQAAQLFAESEEFGTNCTRCVLMAHSSEYLRGAYKKRLPLTHELAVKRAGYLGAGNGVIKYGSDYTLYPRNTLELMNPSKVNNSFMKFANRENLWTSGANFIMWSDRNTIFIPALQTVYNPRNSVLTSELIMQIAVDVEKQCDKVWKLLSGNTDLTPNQFLDRSNEELTRLTTGKYGSRVVITPNAYYTQADSARGYSWVMEAIIYGNVTKTVAQVNVIVRRNFD